MKLLQVITTVFLVLLLCNSCQKNNIENIPNTAQTKLTERDEKTNIDKSLAVTQVRPTVKNGRLRFASIVELKQYYLDIESAMRDNDDKEAVLESFESQYDYVPLRSLKIDNNGNTSTIKDDYFTLDEVLSDLDLDFIGDEIQKSMLSEYYEIGIGSDVYVYMNGDQTFIIEENNIAAINALREVNKTSTKIPTYFLNKYDNVEYSSPSKHYGKSQEVVHGPNPSALYYRYVFSATFNNVDCLLYDKEFTAELTEIEMDDNSTPNNPSDDFEVGKTGYNGNFIFSFGDGTSESFNNTSNPSVIHTYPNTGTFEAVISVNYIDRYGNPQYAQDSKTIVVSSVCQEDDFHVGEWTTSTPVGTSTVNGDVAIATKLWYNKNFWGTHIGGFTKSYKWSSSRAKWRKERADIDVRVWGALRNDNCVENWSGDDHDFDRNSKWVDAKMHRAFNNSNRDIADEDIYSLHKATFDNGVILEDDLVLIPCQ